MHTEENRTVVEEIQEKKDENISSNETEEIKKETTNDEKDSKIKCLEETVSKLNNEIVSIKKAAADILNRSKQLEIDKKYSSSDLVKKLLIPLSYFEGALKFKTDDSNINNFLKGFEMVYNLILTELHSAGLKEIETDVNDSYDPRIHDVSEIVEDALVESETIVEIVEKGFYYKDRVIKPVKVKVSKKIENNND